MEHPLGHLGSSVPVSPLPASCAPQPTCFWVGMRGRKGLGALPALLSRSANTPSTLFPTQIQSRVPCQLLRKSTLSQADPALKSLCCHPNHCFSNPHKSQNFLLPHHALCVQRLVKTKGVFSFSNASSQQSSGNAPQLYKFSFENEK